MRRLATLIAAVACVGLSAVSGAAAAESPAAPAADLRAAVRAGLERLFYARCLTPASGAALTAVVDTGAPAKVLPPDWTITRGAIGTDEITVEVRDPAQQLHDVTLALTERGAAPPDDRGQQFAFYLSPSAAAPDAPARPLLLALAAMFDRAIPAATIAPCAGKGAPRGERRYPRSIALLSGLAQLAILAAAIVYGLRVVRAMAPP